MLLNVIFGIIAMSSDSVFNGILKRLKRHFEEYKQFYLLFLYVFCLAFLLNLSMMDFFAHIY